MGGEGRKDMDCVEALAGVIQLRSGDPNGAEVGVKDKAVKMWPVVQCFDFRSDQKRNDCDQVNVDGSWT